MKTFAKTFGVAALAACAIACSDGNGGGGNAISADSKGLCTKPLDPCGGDPSGTWRVISTCFVELPECSEAYKIVDLPTVTFALTTDGKATVSASGTATLQSVENLACRKKTACDELNNSENNVVCTTKDATTCTCTAAAATSTSGAASYEVTGSTVKLTFDTNAIEYDFCVKGDSLTLKYDDLGLIYNLERQ